ARGAVEVRGGRRDDGRQLPRYLSEISRGRLDEPCEWPSHRSWQRDAREPTTRGRRSVRSGRGRKRFVGETSVDEARDEIGLQRDLARAAARGTARAGREGATPE